MNFLLVFASQRGTLILLCQVFLPPADLLSLPMSVLVAGSDCSNATVPVVSVANANTITKGASDEWNLRSVNPHSHVHPSITSMDRRAHRRTPSLGFPIGLVLVQHEPHPGIPYASQEDLSVWPQPPHTDQQMTLIRILPIDRRLTNLKLAHQQQAPKKIIPFTNHKDEDL